MKKIAITLFAAACICLCFAVSPGFAQQTVPIGLLGKNSNGAPIGGMAVLAILGGGYAIKKLYDGKHKT